MKALSFGVYSSYYPSLLERNPGLREEEWLVQSHSARGPCQVQLSLLNEQNNLHLIKWETVWIIIMMIIASINWGHAMCQELCWVSSMRSVLSSHFYKVLKAKAQRGEFIFPKAHSYPLAELRFETRTWLWSSCTYGVGVPLKPWTLERKVGIIIFIKVRHLG